MITRNVSGFNDGEALEESKASDPSRARVSPFEAAKGVWRVRNIPKRPCHKRDTAIVRAWRGCEINIGYTHTRVDARVTARSFARYDVLGDYKSQRSRRL